VLAEHARHFLHRLQPCAWLALGSVSSHPILVNR
jgi:hypothetical protein